MDKKTVGDITFTERPDAFDRYIHGVYICDGKKVYTTSTESAFAFRCCPSYQISCSRGEDERMDFIDKVFILRLREQGRNPELTEEMNDWVVDYEAKLADDVWVAKVDGELNKFITDSLGDNPVQDFMDRQRGLIC